MRRATLPALGGPRSDEGRQSEIAGVVPNEEQQSGQTGGRKKPFGHFHARREGDSGSHQQRQQRQVVAELQAAQIKVVAVVR